MSSHRDATPFELAEPLPDGVTVLEASAGTGKTYAIAALTARCVAEGTPLERILLITFTRMATGELRERVRERLLAVERELRRALVRPSERCSPKAPFAAPGHPASADAAPDSRAHPGVLDPDAAPASPAHPEALDPVAALLAAGPAQLVARRRERLARALADFDAATIVTTHAFCQEVLGGLGIAGDLEPGVTLVEDLRELVEEVVDDLYVRRFHHDRQPPPISRAEALQIARLAVENPAVPIAEAAGEPAAMRRRLALAVRRELEARKRRRMLIGHDDLLLRLREALRGPDGSAVAARLRARYDLVLVDEFQDTDPLQWDIVRLAFDDGQRALVLVADPKQAIYAFRGADVYAYLEAARTAASRRTLTTNRRSDQGLLEAYDALFADARLGEEGIVYRRAAAAPANRLPRLHGAPRPAPLRIRVVARDSAGLTRRGYAAADAARQYVACDLAAEVAGLLASGAEIETRAETGRSLGREPLHPGHLAVLVRTNRGAGLIRQALEQAGIPAVIAGAGSVFATEAAEHWLRLLEALERPASISRAHAAALTPFVGLSAARVAVADEPAWEEVHARLHDWARVLRAEGVASLLATISRAQRLPERLLAEVDGERRLTDLRHVGQLLHAAASESQLGTAALSAWLRRRILEAERDTADEERARRLESDAQAVQVLTIHRSKGLEFPIVYLPFLWETHSSSRPEPVCFHDPAAGHRRTLDVALQGAQFAAHKRQAMLEQRGQDLRLAYVALTRARHQAIVWWAGSFASRHSPLGRLVFGRDALGNIAPEGAHTPSDEQAFARFAEIANRAPGRVGVEWARDVPAAGWRPPPRRPGRLRLARFTRELDARWRRTSYSDITRAAHEAIVASEPEERVVDDEPEPSAPADRPPVGGGSPAGPVPAGGVSPADRPPAGGGVPADRIQPAALPPPDPEQAPAALPLAALPVGVRAGTLVHQALAATDFAAADLEAELRERLALAPARRTLELPDAGRVAAGLRAAIETPLGELLDGRRLRDIGRADRLDELEFELPLAGGDRPDGWVRLEAVAGLLRERLPAADPLAAYAERLADPALRRRLRGYLTGSLDLVVRVAGPDGPRFALLDYKTNWLTPPGEMPALHHYRAEAVAAEMRRQHYPLQALLYLVALHRYLRWRLPGYDPARHLAGVLYLFLRGMTGAGSARRRDAPGAVFAWRPPAGLVTALSDVLQAGGGG